MPRVLIVSHGSMVRAMAAYWGAGLSESEPLAKIRRLRRLAWLIDAAGRVPGTRFRFGLNSLLGLAPGAGDAVLALISLYIVYEAMRLGVPRAKLARMLVNVAVEAGLGATPLLGDLLDVVWKANLRNLDIIDEHFGLDRGPAAWTAFGGRGGRF